MGKDFADACKIFFATNIESDGAAYYSIFGKHISGGFIALPREGISAEQTLNKDRAYNVGKLTEAGISETAAADIVEYCEDWIARNKPDTSNRLAALFGTR